jgi:hypothetical protein
MSGKVVRVGGGKAKGEGEGWGEVEGERMRQLRGDWPSARESSSSEGESVEWEEE